MAITLFRWISLGQLLDLILCNYRSDSPDQAVKPGNKIDQAQLFPVV